MGSPHDQGKGIPQWFENQELGTRQSLSTTEVKTQRSEGEAQDHPVGKLVMFTAVMEAPCSVLCRVPLPLASTGMSQDPIFSSHAYSTITCMPNPGLLAPDCLVLIVFPLSFNMS